MLRTSQDLKKDVLYLAKKNNSNLQEMLQYLILSGINNFMKEENEAREKNTKKIIEKKETVKYV